jgi:hypothetical protein
MSSLELLETAIGLVFVYLLLSLICSAISEMIEGYLKMRASDLECALRELLNDPKGTGLVSKLYDHPLVSGLFKGQYNPLMLRKGRYPLHTGLPSYIPSRNFALALMDLALPGSAAMQSGAAGAMATSGLAVGPASLHLLRGNLTALGNQKVQQALTVLIDASGDDIVKLREHIEAWYDGAMERVTGWYKRYTQIIIFALGFIVAGLMNADSMAIVRALSTDDALRRGVVEKAEAYVKANDSGAAMAGDAKKRLDEAAKKLSEQRLPLGWGEVLGLGPVDWFLRVLGWLLTATAISLGAPFWFDLLNKFMNVRSALKPATAPKSP